MRRGIKLFHGFVDTSYYLPDYLFSSLPLLFTGKLLPINQAIKQLTK